MFENNQLTVTVAGGSPEENQQLATVIEYSLISCGFNNVQSTDGDGCDTMSVLSALRLSNPELFDTKISITPDLSRMMPVQTQLPMTSFMTPYPVMQLGFGF